LAAGGVVAAGDLFGEQHAQGFGGVPALRAGRREDLAGGVAQVGQPHPAQQDGEFVG
jgi:hypothetical protein